MADAKTAMAPPPAAPPSSPPLEARTITTVNRRLADDVALPAPLRSWRKRSRSAATFTDSSDPPLFSSDGAEAGAENYGAKKRVKRVYQGTWWAGEAALLRPKKRAFERNFDSGVFMGSDSSGIESDELPTELRGPSLDKDKKITTASAKVERDPSRADFERVLEQCHPGSNSDQVRQRYWAEQQRAACVVADAVDMGNPNVDLSGRSLRVVLDATLRPLHCLTLQEKDQSLEPPLRLYLANNELMSLPRELYALKHLTELSIRSNQITSLAPQIGYQQQLAQLNCSMNRLRYLPFSALRMFRNALNRTETITEFLAPSFWLRPNPFLVPVSSRDASDVSGPPPRDSLSLVARSAVCYLSIHGTPLRPRSAIPSQRGSCLHPATMRPATATAVPSAFELCLRSLQRHRRAGPLLAELERFAMESEAETQTQTQTGAAATEVVVPSGILSGLRTAADAAVAGEQRCDVCSAEYVVQRAEWLEWWSGIRDNEDELVPLLRRSCSWGCAARVLAESDHERESETVNEKQGAKEESVGEEWRACGWREP